MRTTSIIHLDAPLLPIEEYARRTGQKVVSVREQCAMGLIPAEKVGRKWHVNVALMTDQALEKEGWRKEGA